MTAPNTERRRRILEALALAAIAFAWFRFFSTTEWTGGDSEQWDREITAGFWLRKRQLLSFAAMQLSYRVGNALFGWSAHVAIGFVSCLAGAVAIVVAREMFRGRRDWGWPFSIVATAGFSALFHGHIETYASPVAAFLLHLLALKQVCSRRWPPWSATATYALFAAFHLVAIWCLPALLLFLAMEGRRRRWRARDWLLAGIPLLLIAAMFVGFRRLGHNGGELIGPHFVVPLKELPTALPRFFTDPTIALKLRFAWQNGGVASLLAVPLAICAWTARRTIAYSRHLAAYFACLLVFTAVWNADAGSLDWDLFSFPWIVATVIVAERAIRLPLRSVVVGALLGANLLLWMERPLVWAHLGDRGYGEIRLAGDASGRVLLLDERMRVPTRLRFVPSGCHVLTDISPGAGMRRVVVVEPGRTYEYELLQNGIALRSISDPQ